MKRCAPWLWFVVLAALLVAALACDPPWSWLVLLGAFGAAVACAERMMARFERVARVMRRRRK